MRNAILLLMLFVLAMPQSGKSLTPQDHSDQINTFPVLNSPSCCPDEAIETTKDKTNNKNKAERDTGKYKSKPETKAAQAVYDALIGEWGNTMYPFEIITVSNSDKDLGKPVKGAFLLYNFREDGTYFKSLGGLEEKREETGYWSLSQDGSELYLHTPCGDEAQVQTIKIKHLQLDELVLEQSLKSDNLRFCSGLKDFYFNKQ